MASAPDKPNSPFRTGKDAPSRNITAKINMALVGAVLLRDFTPVELDGKIFYVFDMGVEHGKRQALILHDRSYVDDPEFARNYKKTLEELRPEDGEYRVHMELQSTIDYILKEKRRK